MHATIMGYSFLAAAVISWKIQHYLKDRRRRRAYRRGIAMLRRDGNA